MSIASALFDCYFPLSLTSRQGIPLPERVVVELADVCRIAGIQQNGPTPLQISFGELPEVVPFLRLSFLG